MSRPLEVAIVGSGPSAFYAAEALVARLGEAVRISMVERLPTPFGLVRAGVAPDHPKIKQVCQVYDGIARDGEIRFFGSVELGRDIHVADLQVTHHAVIIATGAPQGVKLNIPGGNLPGSHTAAEFVGWYNGHPSYSHLRFDLSCESAVVIGQGNVAADVARILLAPVDVLRKTDIARHALNALADSRVREVHLVGRRGPVQARFTPPELRELSRIPDCDTVVVPSDLELNEASRAEILADAEGDAAKNHRLLQKLTDVRTLPTAGRRLSLRFFRAPESLEGDGRVQRMILRSTVLTGSPGHQRAEPGPALEGLECGLVLCSVGHKAPPLQGVPHDPIAGIVRNEGGRVLNDDGQPAPCLYVTGWAKRGPSGIIGTNRADALQTVAALIADWDQGSPAKGGAAALAMVLGGRGARYTTYEDWLRLDQHETEEGKRVGRPREKLTAIDQMLAVLATT